MKPVLVVDASVAVKWFIPQEPEEDDISTALDLLQAYGDDRITLYQPPIWQAEVLAVLSRVVPANAEKHAWRLLAFDHETADSPAVFLKAVQISLTLGHHLFDTIYHAAALSHPGAVLITSDLRYLKKAAPLGRILPLSAWRDVLGI